jgi:hypothetical protein
MVVLLPVERPVGEEAARRRISGFFDRVIEPNRQHMFGSEQYENYTIFFVLGSPHV